MVELLLLALSVISRRRSNSVAFGAKRTSASGLHNRIYDEHAPKREGLWKIEQPEIAGVFEGRDFAYFEAERISDEETKIIRRVEE